MNPQHLQGLPVEHFNCGDPEVSLTHLIKFPPVRPEDMEEPQRGERLVALSDVGSTFLSITK